MSFSLHRELHSQENKLHDRRFHLHTDKDLREMEQMRVELHNYSYTENKTIQTHKVDKT